MWQLQSLKPSNPNALTWKRRPQLPPAPPASWPLPARTLAPARSLGSTQTRSPGNPAQQSAPEPVRTINDIHAAIAKVLCSKLFQFN